MDALKLSVVTISFNQVNFLSKTIDSVISQSHRPDEYMVCDPGSIDGSRDVIESYGQQLQADFTPDQGPADGLNKGFAKCTGEIFYYLNSDDCVLPGAFEYAVSFFRRNPLVDILYGNCFVIDAGGKRLRRMFSDKYWNLLTAYGATSIAQPSTFFRRSAFVRAGGFNASNRSNWDGELFTDMVLSGSTHFKSDSFLSEYRVHSDGITGSGRMKESHVDYSLRMFEKILHRKKGGVDKWLDYPVRGLRHLMNPRDFAERLRFGPVLGAGRK